MMRHIMTTVLLSAFMVWMTAEHDPSHGTVRLFGPQHYTKSSCDKRAKIDTGRYKERGSKMFVKCLRIPIIRHPSAR